MKHRLLTTFLMIAVLFCGVRATAQTASVNGVWYLHTYGVDGILTLNEDGSYLLDLSALGGEDPTFGVWTFDGRRVLLDAGTTAETAVPYDPQENTLTLDGVLCTREPNNLYAPAPVRTDVTAADFSGHWETTVVTVIGIPAQPEEYGTNLTLDLQALSAVIRLHQDGTEQTAEVTAAFADSALTFTFPGGVDTLANAIFTAQLLEDGLLSAAYSVDEEDVIFYLQRVTNDE